MKKLTLFVAALCATTMAVNAAETVTVDLTAGKFTEATTGDNPVPAYITWTAVSDNITITQLKGKSGTPVNSSFVSSPRVYVGQYLSFVCAKGYTITGIEMTYSGSYYGSTLTAGTAVADDDAVTDDAKAIERTLSTESAGTHKFTITNTAGLDKIYIQNPSGGNKQLRLTVIKISYIKAAATEPTIECANLDFGIVVAGTGDSKELVVTGEKLTDVITATLESTENFTVAGTLTATGGTLIISVNASAVGEVSTQLALTSGTASKEVTISANAVQVTGAGTKENPFTVADVVKLNNWGKEAWVEGYIIGALNGSKIDNTQVSNLAIAAVAGETKVENMVAVQLPSGDVRTALNVNDNTSNVGKKVKVYGSMEAYLNLNGVKNTSDYVLGTSPATALENVEALEVYAENGRIYAAEGARIFTVSGIDVTEMNGQLNGIYIVKVGNQATKIAVK